MELQVLALSGLLTVALMIAMALAMNLSLGPRYLAGPRDEQRPARGVAGRLHRAWHNHIEALAVFTAGVVAVELSGANSSSTSAAAQAFLVARVAYAPAYVTGVPYLRSLIWAVGFGATAVLFWAALGWNG